MQKGLLGKYIKLHRWDSPRDIRPSNMRNKLIRLAKKRGKRLLNKELSD